MTWSLRYHHKVSEDIKKLSKSDRQRIKQAIEVKLRSAPEVFGKPLRRSLAGYRKLRVGDYRVIFRIEGKIVKIFIITHRSAVYKRVEGRFLV